MYRKYYNGTDKGSTHSYIEEYDKLISSFKYEKCNIMEIGVQSGFCLKMWKEYFPNATIYGVDIIPEYLRPENRVITICSDSRDEKLIEILGDNKFHLIIDDGSHRLDEQLIAFKNLSPLLVNGGIYVIEDIQSIDRDKDKFVNFEIIDLRKNKGRYDDVLAIYRNYSSA